MTVTDKQVDAAWQAWDLAKHGFEPKLAMRSALEAAEAARPRPELLDMATRLEAELHAERSAIGLVAQRLSDGFNRPDHWPVAELAAAACKDYAKLVDVADKLRATEKELERVQALMPRQTQLNTEAIRDAQVAEKRLAELKRLCQALVDGCGDTPTLRAEGWENTADGIESIQAALCDHAWQDIGGAASEDGVETFRRCTKCHAEQTIETPRAHVTATPDLDAPAEHQGGTDAARDALERIVARSSEETKRRLADEPKTECDHDWQQNGRIVSAGSVEHDCQCSKCERWKTVKEPRSPRAKLPPCDHDECGVVECKVASTVTTDASYADCQRCHGKGGYSDGVSDQWYTCFECVERRSAESAPEPDVQPSSAPADSLLTRIEKLEQLAHAPQPVVSPEELDGLRARQDRLERAVRALCTVDKETKCLFVTATAKCALKALDGTEGASNA